MATFHIPKDDREGFALLRDISDDAFNQLLLTVESEDESDFTSVKGLSPIQAEQIMDAVRSASFVRVYGEVSVEDFVDDLCESLHEDFFGPEQEPRFRERIARMLSSESVVVAAKAFALHNEHERQFCSARIFTDSRPIYLDDPSARPAAMVLTHTLKIEYHGAGGHLHEIYLGIGSGGISKLMDVLIRAKEKAKSLQSTIEEEAKLLFIDPQV